MVLVGGSVAVSQLLKSAPLFGSQCLRYAAAAVLLRVAAHVARVSLVRPRGTDWLWLTGIAATGLVLFNVAIVRGVAHAEPAVIAVSLACVPILLGVAGPWMQGRQPQLRVLVAAVVVTAGAVLVDGTGHSDAQGIGWAAIALVCEACFTLFALPLLPRIGAWGVSMHSVWIGAVMLAVLAVLFERDPARLTGSELGALAYLAVFVTVLAFVLWYSTVTSLGPDRVGLLIGIAPISAALVGMVTGSGVPGPPVWAGVAVVIAGLAGGLRADRASVSGLTRGEFGDPQRHRGADGIVVPDAGFQARPPHDAVPSGDAARDETGRTAAHR